MRLDEDKLDALRNWGERLRQSEGDESRAVGRAILMLTEEIDQLHIELWHVRLQESREAEPAPEEPEEPVTSSLQERLQRVIGREPDSEASPQSWIDSLRRQK